MRRIPVGTVVATLAAIIPATVPAEETAKGPQGKWEITSQQYDGGPAFSCENSFITFTKDRMVWAQRGKKVSYRYTTAKGDPGRIDLVALDDPFKGKTIEAIFEVDGDTLKINMGGFPGVKRPARFGSEKEKGNRHWAFYLKRVKE